MPGSTYVFSEQIRDAITTEPSTSGTRTLTNCLDSGPARVDKLGHLCSDRWKRTVPLPL